MFIPNNKIKDLDELSDIASKLKTEGKKIAHCHGTFDLMHLGHIKHFEAAKKKADVLLVTITQDQYINKGPGRPVFNQQLRAESIASLECVDYVAINRWPRATETIKMLQPNFYVKGREYQEGLSDEKSGIFEENESLKSVGGELFLTDEVTFSSSKLINSHFNVYPEHVQNFLEDFKKRYNIDEIKKKFKEMRDKKVLVIGEAVIDEYHFCSPLGKAGKENLVVMKYQNHEVYAGGVFALVNHLATFCNEIQLVTCLGSRDSKTDFIARNLKTNISTKFFYRDDTQTTVKRRFVDSAFLNKLFEIYYFDDNELPQEVTEQIKNYLDQIIEEFDFVIVLDYAHGFLNDELIELLSKKAKFLSVNTQTNSANFGYNPITKYPKADYVCIDEQELRIATQEKSAPIEDLIKEVADRMQCKKMIVTLGHRGSVSYTPENGFFYVPVLSDKVVDRIGAGDAFLAITSPCVGSEFPMDLVGFIGNVAGALKVQIVGNKSSVEAGPLLRAMTVLLK